jgi:hypothetical protein
MKSINSTTFGLSFGILSPTLSAQLRKQKIKFDKLLIAEFEQNRKSINDPKWSGLLVDSQASKLRQKLMKKITSHLNKINKINKTK